MRQILSSFFILVLIGLGCYYLTLSHNDSLDKVPKAKRVEAMALQDFELTKDLNTNKTDRRLIRQVSENISAGAQRSTNTFNWEDRGPDNFGGRTRTMTLDGKDPTGGTIWTGGVAGGLWKITNAFSENYEWEHINSYNGNSSISSIVVDPSDSDLIYVGTGEGWFNSDAYEGDGIYRSTNGGFSWERMGSTANNNFNFIQKLLISDNRLFACTRNAGIQVSDDRGQTWRKSLGNGQFGFSDRAADIELASNGNLFASMGFAGSAGSMFKSTDNGRSWEELFDPGYVPYRVELAVAPSAPDVIYAMKENSGSRAVEQILKSENGGDSWDILRAPSAFGMDFFTRGQGWFDQSIAIDPNNPDRLIIGGVDLHLSEDGGESWTQLSQWYGAQDWQEVHADQHFAKFLDDTGDRIAFTNDGGLFLSEEGQSADMRIQWKNQGYNTIQFYACAVHPTDANTYIAGTQDNGTHLFTTPGTNSTREVTGGDGAYCHIDRDNPDIQISSYVYHNYYVTKDGWDDRERYNLPNKVTSSFINPTDYDDINDLLLCSGPAGKLITLDIHNGEFDSLEFNEFSARITALKAHPTDGTVHYIGTEAGKVLRIDSLAQGSPKATILTAVSGNVRSIDVDVDRPNRLLFSISNVNTQSIFMSDDYGESWENLDGDLPSVPKRWALFNPVDTASLIVASEVGIWTTDAIEGNSTQWSYNNMGITPTRVNMLDIRHADNTLAAATHGRGLFTTRLCNGSIDHDNDGFTCDNDCDDFNQFINPDIVEVPYNGIDDDCDPSTLDDDLDQDGFNLANDCDDTDATINPDGAEIVDNGIDENCDGFDSSEECQSYDSGPWDILITGGECLDGPITTQWNVWSNEAYIISSMKEDVVYYFDFCDGYDSSIFSAEVSAYTFNKETDEQGAVIANINDCRLEFSYTDDINYPDVLIVLLDEENCDASSNTLGNGFATFGCNSSGVDMDGDGFTDEYDCDDTNAEINPGEEETYYNGIDDDCNEDTADNDQDGDGYPVGEDCDDENPDINPGEAEIPFNNIDDDCDPSTLDNDLDGDGYGLDTDCDETNPNINPGATEIPGNGIDEDCDGLDGVSSVEEGPFSNLLLFPNPTSGLVNVEIEGNYNIQLFNLQGASLKPILKNKVLDLSSYPSGIYVLVLQDNATGARKIEQLILAK